MADFIPGWSRSLPDLPTLRAMTPERSVVALLKAVADQIALAGTDVVKLQALIAELNSSAAVLVALEPPAAQGR